MLEYIREIDGTKDININLWKCTEARNQDFQKEDFPQILSPVNSW